MFCDADGTDERGVWLFLRVLLARTSSAVSAKAFLLQVRPMREHAQRRAKQAAVESKMQ